MNAPPRYWTCPSCRRRLHAPAHLGAEPAQRFLDAIVPKHRCRPPRRVKCPKCGRFSVDLQHFAGGLVVKVVHEHTPTGAEGCLFNLDDPVVDRLAQYFAYHEEENHEFPADA